MLVVSRNEMWTMVFSADVDANDGITPTRTDASSKAVHRSVCHYRVMTAYQAVLFDWMLTLADYPEPTVHVVQAACSLGIDLSTGDAAGLVELLDEASTLPEVREAMRFEDCSAELHRAANLLHYQRAGIDPPLASAMYGLLGDPTFHPIYPETQEVLAQLKLRGICVVVVSDIHVDLRLHAEIGDIAGFIDHWVLSFEHGVQKPQPRIFELALEAAGVGAEDALMVGDRASHDGAASAIGIDTLILPRRARSATLKSNRLARVLNLVV